MAEFTGGCLCGQVRYSAAADPVFTGVCHCKNSQKGTGTAFSFNVGVPKTALSIQGSFKEYQYNGGSGQAVSRHFCANCGSPIISEAAALPGISIIKAGTLDDTSSLKPTMECSATARRPGSASKAACSAFPQCPASTRKMRPEAAQGSISDNAERFSLDGAARRPPRSGFWGWNPRR